MRARQLRGAALAIAVLLGLPSVSRAVAVSWTGDGDALSWSDLLNWNPAGVPDNSVDTYEVGIGGAAEVVVDGIFRINSFVLGSDAALSIGPFDLLGFNADSTLNGSVRLQAQPGQSATLRVEGVANLGGTGEVLFDTSGPNAIGPFSGADVLTLGPDLRVATSGPGASGVFSGPAVILGTVDADAGTVVVQGADKTNSGWLRSTNAGTLTLQGNTLQNAAGRITAGSGSSVEIASAIIVGGVIDGMGTLRPLSTAGRMLQDVQLEQLQVDLFDFEILDIEGTITNNATIRLADTPEMTQGQAFLRTRGPVTLAGSGQTLFDSAGSNNVSGFAGSILTLGPGQMLATTAAANRGALSVPAVIQGTVDANAGSIVLLADVTNESWLRSRNLGTLTLQGMTLQNSAGRITVESSSTLEIASAIVEGGVIEGPGTLRPLSTVGRMLQDVQLDRIQVDLFNFEILDVEGTITNDGTIRLAETPGNGQAFLRTRGPVTLVGSGEVVFGSAGANFVSGFSASMLTLGPNQRLTTGAGGGSGVLAVPTLSQGTIEARAGGTIRLTGSLVNDGVIAASSDGTIEVANGVTGSGSWLAAGGTLRIEPGRSVTTSGDLRILDRGVVEQLGSELTADSVLVSDGAAIEVSTRLTADGGLDVLLADASRWQWSPGAELQLTGGVGAAIGDWGSWAYLEVAGADGGPGGMFSNANFWIPELVVGPGASVFLTDERDSGNRGPGDAPEALYVGNLVFSDPSGVLDANGLELYFGSLTGDPGQIIDLAVPPDRDRDGIANDIDRCPDFADLDQTDSDANGIGDVCECGDQNGDGTVNVLDLLAINAAIFDPSQVTELCDTNDDGLCNVSDILGANAKIFGAPGFCSRYPRPI
jgi:hypothetical protein